MGTTSRIDLSGALWQKASHSGDSGGQCVEVAENLPDLVGVRDSKMPDGPVLLFPAGEWSAFLAGVRDGDFGS
ncbi:hypothetical protein Sme01_02200 [Sphaerisporangium melleum]|uniref:DUF397 domain-containing protein n=1 Tax=Sphaerisporangium melleum TaxID=321316 RepID=A0A917R588_9ACTN|nr:DUF397 domain-containing protein [Sphaerisporangium melleum]GGK88939.1 hypothetical protein GCM10007964_34530 [Sphaerisporangium melleum]GII67744.1 hypothetical protein Sme01_02200 [Sphaerisporangium melleum]